MHRTLLRDPIVLFVAIGAALAGLHLLTRPDPPPPPERRIVMTESDVAWLVQVFQRTRLRPPTVEELRALVDRHVRSEMLYREAVARGLDRKDVALRRRLAAKLEYLVRDAGAGPEPTRAEMEAFLEAEGARYERGPWRRFTQIYVSENRRGENAAMHATEVLEILRSGTHPDVATLGDPILVEARQPPATQRDIAGRFGTEFAARLFGLEVGRWHGPIPSGFGLHLVRVDEAIPIAVPKLEDVRDQVRNDWVGRQKDEAFERYLAELRTKYAVEIPEALRAVEAANE